VGLVGTNDVHFLRREDKQAHEVLTCISTGKTLAEGAMEYSPELFFKSPAQMRAALSAWPQAADNTLRIAEMCQAKTGFRQEASSGLPYPDGQSAKDYLARSPSRP